ESSSRPERCVDRASCRVLRVPAAACLETCPARMRMRSVVQLPPPSIGYAGVELGRGEVGVPEHLLYGAEVGAALEQVRGEGMTQEMRVHALRLEAGGRRELPHDQERAGSGAGPALGVQEQLGP